LITPYTFAVPGRKDGKYEGQDTVPGAILNGYYYRYKKRLLQDGILSTAKRIKEDPLGAVSKAVKHRQVYCVSKRRFFATATQEEMNRGLALLNGKEDKDDIHRIIQCKLR